MKKITKIFLVFALSVVTLLSAFAVACAGDKSFSFRTTPPTTATFGTDIYFREYINLQYGAEYELYASYVDPESGEQVKDEKQDSMYFRFDKVTNYSFTIKKVGDNASLTCDIDCYPELPRFDAFTEYSTYVGETLLFNDLMFWCGVKLKNEDKVIADPSYTYQFKKAIVKSLLVDGADKEQDLSSKALTDTFTFEEEAIYQFEVVAKNKLGEMPFTITANTANEKYHKNTVSGYVFEGNKTIEFTLPQVLDYDIPEDGESVAVRMDDVKGTAKYDAKTGKYTVTGFDKDVKNGEPLRLCVAGERVGYSVMVVAPDLVITQDNIRMLETVKDGYIVLNEDIDMSKLTFTEEEIKNKRAFYGASRTGAYADYMFMGMFDGQGHTIRNFSTNSLSYSGGLFWSVDGATIKNVNFEKATVNGWNSIVAGRAMRKAKFENIAVEVSSMSVKNSSILTGPTESDIEYTNVLMYVATLNGEPQTGTSFFGGFYSNVINPKNVYCITDTALPLTPSHPSIVTTLNGKVVKVTREDAMNSNGISINEMPTQLLKDAYNKLFINYMTRLDESNVGLLQTATSGDYWLEADIDMNNVDLNGDGKVDENDVWTPSSTFVGTLDGQGYAIKNFNGTSLFNGFGGTVKNINIVDIKYTGAKGFLSGVHNVGVDVTVENAVFSFEEMSGKSWMSLVGYVTGGVATLKNVYVEMPTTSSEHIGMITCHAVTGLDLDQVYMVGGNGYYHSKSASNNVNYTPDNETYGKGIKGEENVDYFYYTSNEEIIENTPELPDNIQDAIDQGLICKAIEISAENIGDLQTATVGYYVLTEDIDFATAFTGTWTPTSTFAGTLNGQGFTIKNFSSANLFAGFTGMVKNINFTDVAFSGNHGFLSAGNVSTPVYVENAVFTFKSMNTGAWTGLIGYLTGGVANIKNTYIQMPASTNDRLGFISCNAGTGYVLDQVYMVGGNGSIHSTNSSNNVNYVPDNPSYGKGFVGELNKDYFIGSSAVQLAVDQAVEFTENVQNAIEKGYIDCKIIEISSENIAELQSAGSAYYVLTEDIDFATAFTGTWTPNGVLSGTIDGKGHTIKNFNGANFLKGMTGTIKNLNMTDITFSGQKGFLSVDHVTTEVYVDNCVFTFKSMNTGAWTGLVGYLVGGVANVKNTYIQMPASTNDRLGFISTNCAAGYVLDKVYMVGGNGSIHSTNSGNNANYVPDNPSYGKGFVGELNKDYFIGSSAVQLAVDQGVEFTENVQKAIEKGYIDCKIIEISSENIAELQSAGSAYYVLTEDIDFATAFTGTWTPTSTFAGTLNGQGFTIKNFSGANLFAGFTGMVKNINFTDVAFSGNHGFLSAGNVTTEVYVDSCVFTFKSMNTGAWTGLVGYLVGGVANVKNTYIQMPASTNDRLGFISTNCAAGYVLDKVYMVGGNGSIHSTNSGNNANYVPDNPTYGKGFVGELGKDYYIGSSAIELVAEQDAKFPENIQAFVDNGVIECEIKEISAKNIGDLQTATNGYYVLTEDIDFSKAFTGTWTTNTTFTGTLNGKGKTISNFTGARLFYGFGGTVKNLNMTDITFSGDRGFLAWNGIGGNVYLENTVFTFKTISNGSWTALVGFLTGGVANVKNTYIQMPVVTNSYKGFISSNSGSGYVLDKVYMVGGPGSVHSTDSTNNANYVPDNATYGKGFVGELNKDYFITKTSSEVIYELTSTLPENIKTAITNKLIVSDAVELSAKNIATLQTATSGYFVLTEDIDLTKVDLNGDSVVDANDVWNASGSFGGVLNGNGKTIKNLTPKNGGAGLFHTNNGTIMNLNVHVSALTTNAGVFGRIGNGATLKSVNVVIDGATDYNNGLFMAVQGDIAMTDVSVLIIKLNAHSSAHGGFLCGNSITAGKKITLSNVKLYGAQTVTGNDGALLGQLYGTDSQVAVKGEDYFLYNTDIATAITSAPDFIKSAYQSANA